jgi:hypothetical protein
MGAITSIFFFLWFETGFLYLGIVFYEKKKRKRDGVHDTGIFFSQVIN